MVKKSIEIHEIKNDTITLKGAHNANDALLEGVADPIPSNVFCSAFIAPAGGGKTSLIINLLTQKKAYRRKFDKIFYFSPSFHTTPQSFQSLIHPSRVFPSLEQLPAVLEGLKDSDERCLFVFDDLVSEMNKPEFKNQLQQLCFNRRHYAGGLCLMFVAQKLRSLPLPIRSSVDSVYFFSLNNRRELDTLFEEFTPFIDRHQFDAAVGHCRKEDHCFFFISVRNGKVYKKFNELIIS
jgi:hypothetical protein